MARSPLLAALAVVVTLAFPAASLADSAGDNQYSDPFGNSPPVHSQTPTQPSAPAPSPPASTTAGGQTQPAAATATGATRQLPRTGLDLRVLGGAGVVLLAGGLLLRRRLARDS
ncbi:MAG TPA: hypothetical protein VF032_17215 [Thermoleophilaceae bacterium]